MTQEEFLQIRFGVGMNVWYEGELYGIISVDFEECLIGIDFGCDECPECGAETPAIRWIRCENCELDKENE